MNVNYEAALEVLAQHRQTHVLRFYAELPESSQQKLLEQIRLMNWEQLEAALAHSAFGQAPASLSSSLNSTASPTDLSVDPFADLAPIEGYDWEAFSPEEQRFYEEKGWQLLKTGKVGAVVVAGGQGSRLGHSGPKGTFDIGLPSHKSLFQLQAERLMNLSSRAGSTIPWYIMTSPDNHIETLRFFLEANYFGYDRKSCMFVKQGVMPAVDGAGRILLAAKDEISLAPSGNGECFAVLHREGALADMQRRGVDWLFYYNVDNALIQVADPKFVGVAAHFNHPIATKVVDKASPEEKVGIICMNKNRPAVIEYTDLPEPLMHKRDDQGKLVYGLGNISIHVFRRDWIEQQLGSDLPYHKAHKKIKHINEQGHEVESDQPDGYKFETLIFDYFPRASEITVLRMKREGEFAPVKNKTGIDSPESARQLMYNLHRSWLQQAGVPLDQFQEPVEISPLISYSGEGLGGE
ncbi:UTP--glucose-1-phosphate uridylyltransferase [Paenibacillus agricola]|uniref:UDPGP type 1 family protein n=1 Tax=Paenibacillus agricola TaxID=2716264 RepID=A0ABX0JGG8_9BACL|nr:UDPGP type 1 family protein [Paenibacillus agricola]NHN33987.1 UDPGP type 1 family protein [Paenibacillus agricola]